jgi:ClpP class serine protease
MIEASLQSISSAKMKALAVVINSMGGSPTQCDIISNKLLHFSKNHHIPLYTFAEDFALSGGYYLLSIGTGGSCPNMNKKR